MSKIRSIVAAFAVLVFCSSQTVFAQEVSDTAEIPAQQTPAGIDDTASEASMTAPSPVIHDAYNVPMLFVQTGDTGSFDGNLLTITGVPTTIYFSDRPFRISGHVQTQLFVNSWADGADSFKNDPPNAAISIFDENGKTIGAVLELSEPKFEGNSVTYKVQLLNGTLPKTFGVSSMFIDGSSGAGWGVAGGLLGGLVLGKVLDSSNQPAAPQTTIIQTPQPYYYQPQPYYGYAPQPYYDQQQNYGQPIPGPRAPQQQYQPQPPPRQQ